MKRRFSLLALLLLSVLIFIPLRTLPATASGVLCSPTATLDTGYLHCDQTYHSAQAAIAAAPTHKWKLELACRNMHGTNCDPPIVCPGGLVYLLFRDGLRFGSVCLNAEEAASLLQVTAEVAQTAFESLTWPSARLVLNPPGGRTFVNLATVFSTPLEKPQTQRVVLLGHVVDIEATPVGYTWDPGDGGAEWATTGPGAPYSPGVEVSSLNTYTYAAVQSVFPSVGVTYQGRFRVDGGGWRSIPDTLTLNGEQVPLDVVEGRTHLTDTH